MRLMGKYMNDEWEVMGEYQFDSTRDEEYRKIDILHDYEKQFSDNWQFKWEDE